VDEQLDAAKGGVLFIDEAYELGSGPYGAEACSAIVAAMTDPKYSGLVIVIAGYSAQISGMLNTNPGLKSGFTHFFEFPDWLPSDCLSLFSKRSVSQNFQLEPAAESLLSEGFSHLVDLEGWGNARDVDKLWKAAQQQRADRVAEARELEKTLTEADVQPGLESMLRARRSQPAAMRSLAGASYQSAKPPPVVRQVKQATAEESPVHEEELEPAADGRDAGVSDEVWAELQEAKARVEEEEAQLRQQMLEAQLAEEQGALELERLRQEFAVEEERQQAERRAWEAHQAKLELERLEQERRRKEEERRQAEIRQAQAIREKLRQISPCPAGFNWFKCGGGWRCGGGSHFVSDAQLNAQFTFSA